MLQPFCPRAFCLFSKFFRACATALIVADFTAVVEGDDWIRCCCCCCHDGATSSNSLFWRQPIQVQMLHGGLYFLKVKVRVLESGELYIAVILGQSLHDDVREVPISDRFPHCGRLPAQALALMIHMSRSSSGSMLVAASSDWSARMVSLQTRRYLSSSYIIAFCLLQWVPRSS